MLECMLNMSVYMYIFMEKLFPLNINEKVKDYS